MYLVMSADRRIEQTLSSAAAAEGLSGDPDRECEAKGIRWGEIVHTMRDLLRLLRVRSQRRRERPELEECYRLTGAG